MIAPLAAAALLVGVPAAGASPGQPAPAAGLGKPVTGAARNTVQQRLALVSTKVNSLIGKMTLAEKFGQLEMSGPTGPNGTPGQTLLNEVRNGQVGSVLDLVGVTNINEVQKAALQSRLHIPVIFALDVIHGYKTIFPVPIAEASSWDPAAVQNDEAISAYEATADGIKWTFNPMVDISRDPRWGRVVEGAGEDPYLGSAIAAAKVRGYQGTNMSGPNNMAATVKHFGGYGAPVAGREYNTVDMSTQQLFNDYLPPYKAAVDAGAATVMSAFNSLNGVPASGNPYLLSTILRNEWKFGGTVVSDYQAIQELEAFGFATNGADAARLALTAGVDIEMGVQVPSQYATYPAYGPGLVHSGQVSMATINNDVRHVLTLKYLAGMFANPYTDPNRVKTAELTPAHLAADRTMAAHSMVLLNDKNKALPLSTGVSSVAVVGPLADDPADQLGPDVPIGYNLSQGKVVSVLNGIKAAVPSATVNYAQGCDTTCASTAGFGAAVSAANASDVTVVVVGEPASYSGEASSRSDIGLPGQQLKLVQAIAATGKPYVVVLMNGRPLTIGWLANNAPGLLESWFPGTEGGNAVADVLFGKVNPGGKLPMSFPRNVGQIPISYNELPTGRPYDPNNKYTSKYLDVPNSPQYPFGYGLSYTNFSVSNLHLSAGSVPANGTLTVTATITNTGGTTGDDVAQLYIHESGTSILQPVRRLEGFSRITLTPGQAKTVTFKLGAANFGFYNEQGQFVVEPGAVDVWVGDSSVGGLHGQFSVR
ncbi:MAG TPA: glycoside hydrolase family 3 N-terminal domain-containing protein [Streptosporangiaceae bacterium]|nr:glycoside hydrolase family 3 N-terminal domain-containing protein [Streptosporangiaceae bacterium]